MSLHAPSPRWQTTIADLSLILFLLAASALERETASAPVPGVSLTLWRDEAGALPLVDWLAEQTPDTAHRLAITVTYTPGTLPRALERVARVQAEVGAAAAGARVTLMPGPRDTMQVQLVQDTPTPASGPDIAYPAAFAASRR